MAATAHSQTDSLYRGSALAHLDSKARVTLPAFVRAVSETASGIRRVFLTQHQSKPCIVGFIDPDLYEPYTSPEVLSIKEGGGPRLRRGRITEAERTQLDKLGRIVLPGMFRSSAELEDAILFVGSGKTFEMWSPKVASRSGDEGLRDLAALHRQGARQRRPMVAASGWTGRFSPGDRARFIRNLVPEAEIALRQIIAAYEDKLDNAPPEPLDAMQLQALRQLHAELGALLEALDGAHPIEGALARIGKLSKGMWAIGKRSQRLLLRSTPALASSVPASFALIKILELMLGGLQPVGRAAVAAAVTGGLLKFGAKESRKN
ncbi:MAG TPA: hypothetical protein VMS43_16895 [Allosphingosinicella sp.]|nr:hypothetical protein [Allosphingosinicella sp.]